MKQLITLVAIIFISKVTFSQIVICDTMPINYSPSSVAFYTAPLSSGDSVLTIDITNNSNTNFVYPLARLIPLTPLPPGMNLTTASQDWTVFGSSWNTGQTNPCSFFFDVNQVIPGNYSVTFELYVSNFSPLSIDSCVFANTITINLNPSLSLEPLSKHKTNFFSFSPNPAKGEVNIKFQNPAGKKEIQLFDINGKLVKAFDTNQKELWISLNRMEAGVYYLVSVTTNQREKLVIIK